MGFSTKKNKESPSIFFRVLSVTQNHVLKLRFLSPNLKMFFGPRIKIIRDSKVWEYDYAWERMSTPTMLVSKNCTKSNHVISLNFESYNFNLYFKITHFKKLAFY